MAKEKPAPKPPADLRAQGLEAYDVARIHRRELKNAGYNPRVLNDAERRKLKAGLKRHGLVAPITWNARTGNIVGGHQRISQLDALAGTDDYEITVARIDVDETREKEINILLNNPNAQGDWNLESLSALLADKALNLEGTGFDHADVFRLFGDSPLVARSEALDELAEKVRSAAERYDQVREKNRGRDSPDFYAVVVFRDAGQLTRFLAAAKLPDNRYQSGEEISRLCGVSLADEVREPPAE